MNTIEAVFETYGLAAICVLMLGKAAGIPIPIPGDLILLATAARAAEGKFELWQAFGALLLAIVVGASAQFAMARGPGRRAIYRIASWVGLSRQRLDAATRSVQRRGLASLTLALLTPGLRNAVVPACGLAGLSFRAFLPPLLLATGFDVALHFALGAFGWSVLAMFQPGPGVVALAVVALAALGLVGWLVILRRRSSRRIGREALGDWQAAACPACLVLGALGAADP